MLNTVIEKFSKIKEVKAIVIGGSDAAKTNDVLSDYDIYIFSDVEVPLNLREEIAKEFSDNYEIHNTFYGDGDEWYSRETVKSSSPPLSASLNREPSVAALSNTPLESLEHESFSDRKVFDLMYWNRKWLEDIVESIWVRHDAWGGYTTAFLYTVKNARIKYDPDGWFQALQEKLNTPYPQELANNIVLKNRLMIKDKISASFREQIEKAVKRNDYVSINHRTAAFLAGYFDIIFAVNKILHPGEKRLVNFALKNCTLLPRDFEKNVNDLCCCENKPLAEICQNLDEFLRANGY